MRKLYLAFMLVCAVCSIAVAADAPYLTDAMKNPSYSRALTNLLKSSRSLPSWTKQILKASGDYVGTPVTYSTVDGIKYELFNACKAHDCADNQLEVMFAPGGTQAWGAVMTNGNSIAYLGTPSPAQQSALQAAL
jgi:hypothetical protein